MIQLGKGGAGVCIDGKIERDGKYKLGGSKIGSGKVDSNKVEDNKVKENQKMFKSKKTMESSDFLSFQAILVFMRKAFFKNPIFYYFD